MARGIFEAYLSGEAAGFYRAHFSDPRARRLAADRSKRPLAPPVLEAIRRQNETLAPSPARERNLERLRSGAATIVTGQQLGLFLGPSYTLYKALCAIEAARRLGEETGEAVVPIFWLQSEDHDLPEVSSVSCPDPEGPEGRVVLALPAQDDNRISLAHRTLPPEIARCFADLERTLAGLPFAESHLALLQRHYRSGAGFSAAFAGLLAELTREMGLVFVNPRDPSLAAALVETHREALVSAPAIGRLLEERGRMLEAAGHDVPVHVRPDAPLSFFHPDGPEGPRFRLRPTADGFELIGRPGARFRQAELLSRLDSEPLSFSSSALLRQIVEAKLLSTAVYVGGPAEVAYFAQLGTLFEHFRLDAPLVLPRARVFVIEPELRRRLDRAGLAVRDLAMDERTLLSRAAPRSEAGGLAAQLRAKLVGPTAAALEERRSEILALGPGMERALRRTQLSAERAFDRFLRKVESAELHRDQQVVERVRKLRGALYPGGSPQERVFGFSSHAARHGELHFMEAVRRAIDPFRPDVLEVGL